MVVNSLVIAEIVWTLESYYGLARDNVKDKVFAILNTPDLEAAEEDLLLEAIFWHEDKNIDFIDAFDAAWMLVQGLETANTFERRHFSRIEGIRVRIPGE